ncbi:MAG: gliding motility-associated C-terminal domain-containing protein [Chitinophagaceae bacterium]|nr:MAG: gliding motility-associated C-terminal domain-containing protein [Chitinophagaceae bacterium]
MFFRFRCILFLVFIFYFFSLSVTYAAEEINVNTSIFAPDYSQAIQVESLRNHEKELLFNQVPKEFHRHPEFATKPFRADCENCVELIHLRNEHERTYIKPDGRNNHFFYQQSFGPMHFKDEDGFWKTLDYRLFPNENNSVFSTVNQPIDLIVSTEKSAFQSFTEGIQLFEWKTAYEISIVKNSERIFQDTDLAAYKNAPKGVLLDYEFSDLSFEIQSLQIGQYKTQYILNTLSKDLADAESLIIQDKLILPEGWVLQTQKGEGIEMGDGGWYGGIEIIDENGRQAVSISSPLSFDSGLNQSASAERPAYYRILKKKGYYILEFVIDANWLKANERVYPVIIDPLISVTYSYSSPNFIPFTANTNCMHPSLNIPTNFCTTTWNITVPGMSTLVGMSTNFRVDSQPQGCGLGDGCRMIDAYTRLLGPCGSTGLANCDSLPQSLNPGSCNVTINDAFNAISCLPPSCPDHEMAFELRTYHCTECASGNTPQGCLTICHNIIPANWTITVEARTVEAELFVITDVSSGICPEDTIEILGIGSFGVPPYELEWIPYNLDTNEIFIPSGEVESMQFVVTDLCGNTDTASADLSFDFTEISLSGTDAFCEENPSGTASVDIVGPHSPYSIAWSNGTNDTETLEELLPGLYSVTVTDTENCINIDTIEIDFQYEVTADVNTLVQDCTGIAEAIALSGEEPFTYAWSDGQSGVQAENLSPGSYSLELTDVNGCQTIQNFTVEAPDGFTIEVLGPTDTLDAGEPAALNVEVIPTGNYNFVWTPSNTLDNAGIQAPVAVSGTTTTYNVEVTDLNTGCVEEDNFTVFIRSYDYMVPTAFTPNSDGVNDKLFVVPAAFLEVLEFKIYNRWGQLIHDNPTPWDGYFQGVEQPIGVYVYYMVVKDQTGQTNTLSGNVTLLR